LIKMSLYQFSDLAGHAVPMNTQVIKLRVR
jgi:hypothetical protein